MGAKKKKKERERETTTKINLHFSVLFKYLMKEKLHEFFCNTELRLFSLWIIKENFIF